MNVLEIAPGFWRWTARHPDWAPEEGGPDGWDPDVGCIYYEAPDAIVLIDPLVPADERERFWTALDRDVARADRPLHVLVSLFWHVRSAQAILERYDGARVWAHAPARKLIAERTSYTDVFRVDDTLPGGVRALDAHRAWEVLFWLPEHRALVAGDVLLGAEDGRVRMCPDSWLGERDPRDVRAGLRALLELPVERVLVSHGEPVLTNGKAALQDALT
jgi:glyoxylase-like metal-dependent hydrolase (beta-lactamase superfamily II)